MKSADLLAETVAGNANLHLPTKLARDSLAHSGLMDCRVSSALVSVLKDCLSFAPEVVVFLLPLPTKGLNEFRTKAYPRTRKSSNAPIVFSVGHGPQPEPWVATCQNRAFDLQQMLRFSLWRGVPCVCVVFFLHRKSHTRVEKPEFSRAWRLQRSKSNPDFLLSGTPPDQNQPGVD